MMKQVILVRKDLKMRGGKLGAQCAHASVEALMMCDKREVARWRKEGGKKVVLGVVDMDELLNFQESARKEGLKCALITDAGRTFFKGATVTCLGIGPDEEKKIDKVTGKLKML